MSRRRESVVVRRPVSAELVPSGQRIDLEPGTMAEITQALGSSFTLYVEGHLVRLPGGDADAIGKPVPQAPDTAEGEPGDLEARIWRTLKTCYDPEIPVDIVELGLVYVCDVLPLDDERFWVSIKMTLTAPGCGMGETIAREVREKVEALPRIDGARVEVVFDPPWDRSMMSEAAQLALGM